MTVVISARIPSSPRATGGASLPRFHASNDDGTSAPALSGPAHSAASIATGDNGRPWRPASSGAGGCVEVVVDDVVGAGTYAIVLVVAAASCAAPLGGRMENRPL